MEGRIGQLVLRRAETAVVCPQAKEQHRCQSHQNIRPVHRHLFRVGGNTLRVRWLLRSHACSTKFMPPFPLFLLLEPIRQKLKILSDRVTFPASWPCYNLCILCGFREVLFVSFVPSFPHIPINLTLQSRGLGCRRWQHTGNSAPPPRSTFHPCPCSVSPEPEHTTEWSELMLVFLLSPIFLALMEGALGRRGFPNIENRPISYPLA